MKSIVVIDDDEDIREVIVYALENEGHKVISFENGRVALESLSRLNPKDLPGLIIVDYLMPIMDGVTFIKTLKSDYPGLRSIPLAMSTAMGKIDHEVFTSYEIMLLHKPIDLEDLLKVTHSCLDQ